MVGIPEAAHDPEASVTAFDDKILERLRQDFAGHRVWRSVRYDGKYGDWVATLHDPAAGIYPTVIKDSAEELRAALVAEAERARRAVR